jgi:hypothetical protein
MSELLNEYFLSKGLNIIQPDEATFNTNTPITIICPKNSTHTYKASISQIKTGRKDISSCPHCHKETKYKEMGLPKTEIEEYAKQYNLDFEPKQEYYNKWTDQITFICKNGHNHTIKALNHWSLNKPQFVCDECNKLKLGIKTEQEYEQIINNIKYKNHKNIQIKEPIFNKEITTVSIEHIKSQGNWHIVEFNGTRSKSKFICLDCGYEKETLVRNLDKCQGCRNIINKTRIYEKIKDICKENNIYPTNPDQVYVDCDTPIELKCNECGYEFEYNWHQITGKYYKLTCPKCYKSTKRQTENEIYDFISSIYPVEKIEQNNKKIITPHELDIYIDERKLAIEFCGNVWHCEKYITDRKYHYNKYKKCLELGIKLITIFEDEWIDKQEICKSRIKNYLGQTENKIYAKDCTIVEINKVEADNFCKLNHIQGADRKTDIAYALIHENKIVSLMTFKVGIESRKGDWELNRFCNLINHNVVGAFSRLLKRFRDTHPNSSLFSYSDNRWSNGEVYDKNGFTFKSDIPVRYSYVGNITGWKRRHRFTFNKKRLYKMFGISQESEHQIADKHQLYRLWDCGYKKWELIC